MNVIAGILPGAGKAGSLAEKGWPVSLEGADIPNNGVGYLLPYLL